MTGLFDILLFNLVALATASALLWIVSLLLKDASIADIFWGLGFVLVAWTSWLISGAASARVHWLVVLVTVWGVRLAIYLLTRRWGAAEDRRYAAMRQRSAQRFWWLSFFSVFMLQAALIWFVAMPVQWAAWHDDGSSLSWLDGLGIALWFTGFCFEAIGDWQLASFKNEPSNTGRVMDQGLWRYTRHPNYFGDFCVWWGIYLIAVAGGAAVTIASPILMSLLLIRVSGVALLESTIADRRPGYADYMRRVNAFFPGPPRRQRP